MRGDWKQRLLGGERPWSFAHVAATLGVFVLADWITLHLAPLAAEDLFGPVLFLRVPLRHPLESAIAASLVGALILLRRSRLCESWETLDEGRVLRILGGASVVWLAWRMSMYDFNYVLGRWHAMDRVLVVLLAAGSVWRPMFLLPFVLQARLLNNQFTYPLGTDFGQNADELLVMVPIALAAGHLLYVATGKRDTAPVLLILTTAVAAHLYVPGRAKIQMDWMAYNDLSNFPLNSYTAGWRGAGDGRYAQRLGEFISAVGWPLRAGTMVMELGAVVAVAHHRLLRLWLPMWAAFHALTFALSGFLFLDWIVLEAWLFTVLMMPNLRGWVEQNATPPRALGAMIVVMAGTTVYHPPALAWMDGPVAYGYQVEATGVSGRSYHVPPSAFAPFAQEITFAQVALSPRRLASGGYGATLPERLQDLRRLRAIDELAEYEAGWGAAPGYPDEASEQLITRFVDSTHEPRRPWFLIGAPSRFWSGREAPVFEFQEPLETLSISLLASLTVDGTQHLRQTRVLSVERPPNGRATVVGRAPQSAP